MPSWGQINKEINELVRRDANALDLVRRKYIATQQALSKRALILYASRWTQPTDGMPQEQLVISDSDVHGYMEACHGVKEKQLDLILHSPGGSIAAADACVQYLRKQFDHIRVFVPQAAMSAATMIACAADEIVMGAHSSLGPIDPQFGMNTSLGGRMIPAQAILDQFEMAKKECADPSKLAVWLPMLQQYGPDLLIQCRNASVLSNELVGRWLTTYMFKEQTDAAKKAKDVAAWLSSHGNHLMHGRYLDRDVLRDRGLNIVNLENDKQQQDAILSIFHATTLTFARTGCTKIIENHLGNAFITQVQQVVVQQQFGPSAPQMPKPSDTIPPFPKKKL